MNIYTKFHHVLTTISNTVVDYSRVRGWSFPRGSSQYYEPILYHHKCKSTADKALIVHFLSYISYDVSYCFLIAALYWDPWGGRFRAADIHHITGCSLHMVHSKPFWKYSQLSVDRRIIHVSNSLAFICIYLSVLTCTYLLIFTVHNSPLIQLALIHQVMINGNLSAFHSIKIITIHTSFQSQNPLH